MKIWYQTSKFSLLIIVILMFIFFACRKTTDKIISPPPPVVTTVTASVAGHITDLNDVPISNASVAAGTSTTTTDVNGQFTIENAKLNADAGLVTITKPGYFDGSRTFSVNANTVNNVSIQLIPKTVSGTFDAASGGNINVSGGGSVNFGGNNVVSASNGTAYTGTVSVSTFYLNPGDANFSKYMPGDLRGLNASGQQKILQSFGMVLAELNDAAGNKLQIAAGKTATITIPIPSAMQANAPSSIPLWYFNDTMGIWKQQGSATKQGNNYVGTVAHFSFWTAGQLAQSVRLDVTFKDSAGNVLANKLVTITRTDSTNHETTNGYTDSSGKVSGLIPANETLVLKVFDQNIEIYSKSTGPFTADTDLGVVTITITPSLTLYGTVVDCNNNPVTTGSVNVFVDNTQSSADVTNGNFTITFNRYNNLTPTATIDAFDKTTLQTSPEKVITITSSNQNVGQFIACAASASDSSYINLTLNGTTFQWAYPDSIQAAYTDTANNTLITGQNLNSIYFYILNDNTSPGSYNITLSANLNGISYPGNSATTTVTEYDAIIGGYVIGTSSGQMMAADSTTSIPFTMTYKAKRKY